MFEPVLVQEVKLYTRKFSEVLAMASSRMLVPASPQEADLGEMEEVEEVDVEEAEGPWKRTRAFMVPAVGLVLLAVGILGIFAAGHVTHGVQEQGIIEEVEEFKIPELPPNPLDELKKEAVVQLGSLIVKTAANCPAGFDNVDKKIACNINIAALFVTLSECTAFLTSLSTLCTGKTNPDARCTVFMALTFRHLALFPAAENQMALFCPKNSLEQTVIQGGVTTEDAGERRLEANASSFVDRFLQEMPDMPQPPPKPVDKVFCAWNVAESFWFFTRIPPLIDIATRRCPAKKSSKAACSEVINNILTMMFNSVKLMAAASTNCVDGMNVAAGCTAGTLNFMSGITGISWVTSAFANGACTDLDAKRKAATEARINKKINKINLIKDATLRRLLREKKLSGSAITEAHKVIAQDEADIRNNATTEQLVRRLVPDLDLENADPHELAMSYLQGVKPPTDSEHQQMMATLQMLHDKYSTKDDDSKRPPLRGVQGYAFLASSSRPVKSTPYLGLLESSIGNDYAWHACPFNEVVNSLASKVVVRMRLGPGRLWQNGGCGGLRESDESPIGRCQSPQ
eukprot:symbB.v1.2.037198.t1/scaffold5427.1/size27340/1